MNLVMGVVGIIACALYSMSTYCMKEQPTQFSPKIFLLGEEAAITKFAKLSPDTAKKLNSLGLKAIRAACNLLLEGDLAYLDCTDRANGCHLNSLLVNMIVQNDEFKKICGQLSGLPDQDLLKAVAQMDKDHFDRLRLLTLSLLRYVPMRTRFHSFEELADKLNLTDEKTVFRHMLIGQKNVAGRIGAETCAQLAELRIKLYDQILNIDEIRNAIPFKMPISSLFDMAFNVEYKDAIIKSIPKLPSMLLFIAIVKNCPLLIERQLIEKPIYIKLLCNGKLAGYIDYTLQKFISQARTGPVIQIQTETEDKSEEVRFDSVTGLLRGCTPQEILLSSAAYFAETQQQEGREISRQYIQDFDKLLQQNLDIQKQNGINIIHTSPNMEQNK